MSPRGGTPGNKGGRPVKDPSGPTKFFGVRLPPATIDAIKEFASADGVSHADVITGWARAEREKREPK